MKTFTHSISLTQDFVSRGRGESWQGRSAHAANEITSINPHTKKTERGYKTLCGKTFSISAIDWDTSKETDEESQITCERCKNSKRCRVGVSV